MDRDNFDLLFWIVQIFLIILKLAGVIVWSWWIVLSPLLIIMGIGLFLWLMDNL